ncbi:MAG: SRPBCC family protein [Acidimicrobiales bacterium]
MTDSKAKTDLETPGTEAGSVVVLTQRIAAPPEAVFEFLVDPEKVLRWMGRSVDIDPRPGGQFRLAATVNDTAVGTYVEVDRPNRVVFTWGWEGSAEVPPGSSTVTFTLSADEDDTVVELRHEGLPEGTGDSHSEGWGYFLPRLGMVAVGEDPGPDRHAS